MDGEAGDAERWYFQLMSEPKVRRKISQFEQIFECGTDSLLSRSFLVGLPQFVVHSVRIIPAQLVTEPLLSNTDLLPKFNKGFQFEFSEFYYARFFSGVAEFLGRQTVSSSREGDRAIIMNFGP